MGSERLSRLLVVAAIAAVTSGCAHSVRPPPPEPAPLHGRHLQIFHALKTPARHALINRLRERNPTSRWTVNEDALVASLTVIDPFAGFLRRARREGFVRAPRTEPPIDEGEAAVRAHEFVKRNADLLGLPRHVALGLAEHVRPVEPSDHATPRTTWVVRLDAPFPSKGYESFKEIDNLADVEVLVDDDGVVSSFVNLSRVHPHLTIDTKPLLTQEDPRVLANLIGRRLFALETNASVEALDLGGVRALRRIQLGEVSPADVTHMQLVIHVSTGPQLAWLTYRLGYYVEIAKPGVPDAGSPPQFFFFRYVVDADTGAVLEDASAPVATAAPSPSP